MYEKGSLGYYREKAKEYGFNNVADYLKWKNKNINFNPFSNKNVRKEYHLLRWKIKRILIEENIIKNAYNWKTVLDKFDQLIIEILINDKIFEKSEIIEKLRVICSSLVEHHTRYKEIHGYDESIWMTRGEHKDFHYRLRKDGKCKVPSEELKKISLAAKGRTERRKKQVNEYHNTEKFKQYNAERMKKHYKLIMFTERMAPKIELYEEIILYDITNHITVSSGFRGNRIKISTIKID